MLEAFSFSGYTPSNTLSRSCEHRTHQTVIGEQTSYHRRLLEIIRTPILPYPFTDVSDLATLVLYITQSDNTSVVCLPTHENDGVERKLNLTLKY